MIVAYENDLNFLYKHAKSALDSFNCSCFRQLATSALVYVNGIFFICFHSNFTGRGNINSYGYVLLSDSEVIQENDFGSVF